MRITLVHGDLTRQEVDAIVNAANSGLYGGGGVDGAIHRAAGPALAEECRQIRERLGGCPTGRAVITGAGRLPARFVIHTVGPVWRGGRQGEPRLLYQCYVNSLVLAEEYGLKSVAFPAVSCGVYGFPIEKAVRIAFDAVEAHPARRLEEVRFVLFGERDYHVYRREKERRKKDADTPE
ncbi:MAG: O-acetyl-ADP-ribose deacetylase [Kiritimatiellaeota bacterium]|nr:O-acetyl-ADP-ribose deacetylase [Kiritimatiellota bacterium]